MSRSENWYTEPNWDLAPKDATHFFPENKERNARWAVMPEGYDDFEKAIEDDVTVYCMLTDHGQDDSKRKCEGIDTLEDFELEDYVNLNTHPIPRPGYAQAAAPVQKTENDWLNLNF